MLYSALVLDLQQGLVLLVVRCHGHPTYKLSASSFLLYYNPHTSDTVMNTSTPRPTQFLGALTAPYYVALQTISEPAFDTTSNTSLESLADMSEPTIDEDGRHDDTISWPTNIDPEIMFQPIYKPTGKWGWINGLPIIDSDLKTTICCEWLALYTCPMHVQSWNS